MHHFQRHKRNIAVSLVFYILLFSSVITLVSTAVQLLFEYRRDMRHIESTIDQIKLAHIPTIASSLWVYDLTMLGTELQGIRELPDVEYVAIVNKNKNIISVGNSLDEHLLSYEFPLTHTHRDQELALGTLKVDVSLIGVYKRLKERVIIILVTQAFKTFLVSSFIFVLFFFLVGRHLKKLAHLTMGLTIDNLTNSISLERKKPENSPPDELDTVVNAINTMRRNLIDDIEARLLAEKTLREHEILLDAIIEGTSDAVFLKDLKGRYILANEATAKAVGIPKKEIVGKTDADIFPEESAKVVSEVDTRVLESGMPFTAEERLETTFGISIWLANKNPFFDENGNVSGLIGISRNVTEFKKTREELDWEVQVNKALAELANNLITSDQHIRIIAEKVYACAKLLSGSEHGYVSEIDGVTRENVCHTLSTMPREAFKLSGSDQRIAFPCGEDGSYPKLLGFPQNTGESFFTNTPGDNPDYTKPPEGHIEIKKFLSVPVKYGGEIVGQISLANSHNDYSSKHIEAVERIADLYALSIYSSRTSKDRTQMEGRLQQAQKMEAIGSLAGGIAHDFNNILSPIVGMSEMLIEDLPGKSAEQLYAKEIFKAGQRAGDLVKQILSFSRQAESKAIPIKIHTVLKEVLKLCRSTIPSDIEIIEDIQHDCGLVKADSTQIHQVAMNLITNAYHAVEEKSGKITVHLKELELGKGDLPGSFLKTGLYVKLAVADTGTGIDSSIIDEIFNPYFTTKEQGKGTGLGLATVYRIVREYQGDIKVYSEIGIGSTFNVYLPVIEVSDETQIKVEKEILQTGEERILLVDDEEPIVELEKIILERLGYHVTPFTSSIEALKSFQYDPKAYDLVISDMTMPYITGDLLSRELKEIRADIPILICTGFSERMNKEQIEAIGVDGFLTKPVVRAEFSKKIREILDKKE